MNIKYPKVYAESTRVYISFYINKKRYRLSNGKRIGSDIDPNSFPESERLKVGKLLAAEAYRFLIEGGTLTEYRSQRIVSGNLSDKEIINKAYNLKLSEDHSKKYKSLLSYCYSIILRGLEGDYINSNKLINELNKYLHNTTFNTVRRHINVILNKAVELGLESNPIRLVRSKRTKAKLHKPFDNLKEVLEEIKEYNLNC